MIELTILSGSCTLELKFLAEQAVNTFRLKRGERLQITGQQQVFHIVPVRQPQSMDNDRQAVLEQRVKQWQCHLINLLNKS